MRWCRLRLLIRLGSDCRKKRGASSTSHFGSMIVHSRMYSFVVISELVVDHPVRLTLEQRAAGVDVHWLILHQCSVALLGVLPGCVEKEPTGDGLPNLSEVAAPDTTSSLYLHHPHTVSSWCSTSVPLPSVYFTVQYYRTVLYHT